MHPLFNWRSAEKRERMSTVCAVMSQCGSRGLILVSVPVLVVVLFHVEAASCGFVAVAFAESRSGL